MSRLLLFICLAVVPLFGAIDEELKTQLDAETGEKVDEVLRELIKPERICRENFFTWPLTAATNTREAILKAARQKGRDFADKKVPKSDEYKLITQSRKLFPLYRTGQRVTLHPIVGPSPLEGTIRGVTERIVRVGNYDVRILDLPENEQAFFNAVLAQQKASEYEARRASEIRTRRARVRREAEKAYLKSMYEASGYVQVNGKWIPIQEYVLGIIEKAREDLRKKLAPLAEIQIYLQNGLEKYNGDWMSREEAEERRAGEGGGDFEVDGESAEGEDAFADEGGGDAELPPTEEGPDWD
ncbi:MAG TPA: hypothetical protein DCR55_11345 [Lentisphaeria bacterium]|jgi:hypothetical protein|nr:hypothetical protein [Lentisphaeria bacterium]